MLLYKSQGKPASHGFEHFSINEFNIAIQTSLQADILKKVSSDRIVYMDSTYGTNGYYFNLITVIMVDEFGAGIPVAWCISNREDQ